MPGDEHSGTTLTDILDELKSQRSKKKDVWDRLVGVAALLSTLATMTLGGAGLWFTHSYNVRQSEINERQTKLDQENRKYQTRILEMQTVEKFIPYLTTEDEKKKKVALLAITSLGSPEFATQFAMLDNSKGTQAAADVIMATASSSGQTDLPAPVTSRAAVAQFQPAPPRSETTRTVPDTASPKKTGWVYLGHYIEAEQRWETRYFDFDTRSVPDSMVSSILKVRKETGTINVRTGMPSLAGEFQRVFDVLKPPSQVKVLAVKEWYSTGYIWAQIEYEI